MTNSAVSKKSFMTTSHDQFVHEYAKGGIAGATIINGGAAVAVISQLARLDEMDINVPVALSMTFWTLGLVAAALAWILALGSSRYVSRAQQDNFDEQSELAQSDFLMLWGFSSIVSSIAMFALGVFVLIGGFVTQGGGEEAIINYLIIVGAVVFGLLLHFFITKRFLKETYRRSK